MKIFKIFVLLAAFLIFNTQAFAGRLPGTKRAEHVIYRYFVRYGHKFTDSDFGKSKPEKANIFDIQEIHKKLVSVTAEVKLAAGPSYMVRCILEKKALGWRFVSWEKL